MSAIETLPLELQRNYTLIRQLDQAAQCKLTDQHTRQKKRANRILYSAHKSGQRRKPDLIQPRYYTFTRRTERKVKKSGATA
jgi:hypothetical protein